MNISLELLPKSFAVLKVGQLSDLTDGIKRSNPYIIVQSKEEISVLCEEGLLPDRHIALNSNWRIMKFAGAIEDGIFGIVGAITQPLAKSQICVITYTTFDAGYFGVQSSDLEGAIFTLNEEGIRGIQQ